MGKDSDPSRTFDVYIGRDEFEFFLSSAKSAAVSIEEMLHLNL